MNVNVVLLILRLIHILSGVFWVGTTLFLTGFLGPSVAATAPEGGKVMQHLLVKTRLNATLVTVASLSALTGVIMYIMVSGGFNPAWMGTGTGLSLTIGAVFGLLSFGQGLGVILPNNLRMVRLAKEVMSAGGPPSPEQAAEIGRIQVRSATNGRIISILLTIAVIGMAISEAL